MWIKDHVDAYDLMKCPHCGHEATFMEFSQAPCASCGVKMSFEEWPAEIEYLSLTWVKDEGGYPADIIVSDDEARRILGKEYETRKVGWAG